MQKITFHIQKGGVGKTTLSGNVAAAAARSSRTVLVDADPQGSLTSWLLSGREGVPAYELADVLKGEVSVREALIEIKEGLQIIPTAGIGGDLKQYGETQILNEPFVFEDLCGELEGLGYELAIFDLGPGMSILERCAILAMDEVITPLTPEFLSWDGIEIFTDSLQRINRAYRKDVKHRRIVANMVNRSFRRHGVYYERFEGLGFELFTVPQDAKIAEAQMLNLDVFEYAPGSKAGREIEKLTAEIVRA